MLPSQVGEPHLRGLLTVRTCDSAKKLGAEVSPPIDPYDISFICPGNFGDGFKVIVKQYETPGTGIPNDNYPHDDFKSSKNKDSTIDFSAGGYDCYFFPGTAWKLLDSWEDEDEIHTVRAGSNSWLLWFPQDTASPDTGLPEHGPFSVVVNGKYHIIRQEPCKRFKDGVECPCFGGDACEYDRSICLGGDKIESLLGTFVDICPPPPDNSD